MFRKCFITVYTSVFLKPKKVSEIELENWKYILVTRQDRLRQKWLLSRWAGEGHLQPELVRPRQPAVHMVGWVGQAEVNHGDTCPRAPGAGQGRSRAVLLELSNHLTHRHLPRPPSLHTYPREMQSKYSPVERGWSLFFWSLSGLW